MANLQKKTADSVEVSPRNNTNPKQGWIKDIVSGATKCVRSIFGRDTKGESDLMIGTKRCRKIIQKPNGEIEITEEEIKGVHWKGFFES